MPDYHIAHANGQITHVFGHRFVVETDTRSILADVTPKGLEQIRLRVGDTVELTGEQKPSELKVTRFVHDGKATEIERKKKHDDHHHHDADPKQALKAARAAGFETIGDPRRKPKHFEVLGRRDRDLIELHIELDGHIRKTKPVDRHEPKWAEALAHG